MAHGTRFIFSRSAGQLPEHIRFTQELGRQGCLVDIVAGDLGCAEDVILAVSKAGKRAIGGATHLSMVLQVSYELFYTLEPHVAELS
jgi:hypothetical protein